MRCTQFAKNRYKDSLIDYKFIQEQSTFEGLHTKKKKRLDATRLNNLVYIHFNAKNINKKEREEEDGLDVLVGNEASMAQGWIAEGGDEEVQLDSIMDVEASR